MTTVQTQRLPLKIRDLSFRFDDHQAPRGQVPGTQLHLPKPSRRPAATLQRSKAADPHLRTA